MQAGGLRTAIGLYDDQAAAQRAIAALTSSGFARNNIDILTLDDRDDEPKLKRLGQNIPQPDINVYLEGVRRGGALITVSAPDADAARAAEILKRTGTVDIDAKAAELSKTNSNMQLRAYAPTDPVIEVVEESLEVGKRQVERGRMRLYSKVSERDVAKDISLRDETISVQRRAVDRPVSAADASLFQERSFEMTETDEEAVVSKSARVVEEVVLTKELVDQMQTVHGTVRRTDVGIERLPAIQSFNSYANDFRSYYDKNMASSGMTYEQFTPAMQYGYSLASNDTIRGRDWTSIEADARRVWEQKNPGTWDQYKGGIQYAYERALH
jgi:uncharacterized protein (TIGR02271 family)